MKNGHENYTKSPGILPWRQLMALKKVDDNTYESVVPAWAPGFSVQTTSFGGHVYAQSVCAAAMTVPHGTIIHNITGHFLLPGTILVPYTYHVRRLLDGTRYCLRNVEVFQHEPNQKSDRPCFIATMSFKKDERIETRWEKHGHQDADPDHIDREYTDVLKDIAIDDLPIAPNADTEWWYAAMATGKVGPLTISPGLDVRKVNMDKYHDRVLSREMTLAEKTSRWRQLLFYRTVLDAEEENEPNPSSSGIMLDSTDLNLAAAAHCYASDRNSLFLIPRALRFPNRAAIVASLGHTVIFHGPLDGMRLVDLSRPTQSKWFVSEAWTPHSGSNRGLHESRLWDYETGHVVATTYQDGMVRIPTQDTNVEETLKTWNLNKAAKVRKAAAAAARGNKL